MEAALLRILDLFSEQAPTGTRWHADPISRAARDCGDRPTVLRAGIAAAANETRRFRSVAAHAYDHFDKQRAAPAVAAAATLAKNLSAEMARFRELVDP